jgi:uncharacterized protein
MIWIHRMSLRRLRIAAPLSTLAPALFAFLIPAGLFAEVPIPTLRSPVMDLVGKLSFDEQKRLEENLRAFEREKGAQIAVLILPTTEPETIEQYSIRVAEEWKLGRKGVDDGILFVVALEDRAVRIEVGYGLEGAVTDLHAKRIIDGLVTPRFREGDFDRGIADGASALMQLIRGEELPPAVEEASSQGGEAETGIRGGALIFAAILGAIARMFSMQMRMAVSLGAAVIVLLFLWITATFLSGLITGAITFVIVLIGPQAILRGAGSSGGSGGGGWSGGGGSFGGGGASGRW